MNRIKHICEKVDRTHPGLQFIFWWVLIIVFTSIVLPAISPTNPYYFRADTSVFYLIGTCWTEGLLPYRDLFDHKGPLLYVIYALGELIWSGKGGLFLLLSLFLSGSFYIVYRTARLYIATMSAFIVTLLYMGCTGGILGGYSEDFSLPFIVYPLYLMLRHLRKGNSAHDLSWQTWLTGGACFAAIALLRLNNAALVCGLVLAYGLLMLKNKQFLPICRAAALFLAGTALVVAPMAIILYSQGILADAIYGGYTFNFKFASKGIMEKDLDAMVHFVRDSLCFWGILIAGFRLVRLEKLYKSEYFCLLIAAGTAVLCLLPGMGYFHYFTFASPALACTLILLAMLVEHHASTKALLWACAGWALMAGQATIFTIIIARYGIYCTFFPEHHRIPSAEIRLKKDAEAISRFIPDNEKKQAIIYGGMANVYHYTGCRPSLRYFCLQNFMSGKVPDIKEELLSQYNSQKAPRWVIFQEMDEDESRKCNPALDNFLNTRCNRVDFGGMFDSLRLYRRND